MCMVPRNRDLTDKDDVSSVIKGNFPYRKTKPKKSFATLHGKLEALL